VANSVCAQNFRRVFESTTSLPRYSLTIVSDAFAFATAGKRIQWAFHWHSICFLWSFFGKVMSDLVAQVCSNFSHSFYCIKCGYGLRCIAWSRAAYYFGARAFSFILTLTSEAVRRPDGVWKIGHRYVKFRFSRCNHRRRPSGQTGVYTRVRNWWNRSSCLVLIILE